MAEPFSYEAARGAIETLSEYLKDVHDRFVMDNQPPNIEHLKQLAVDLDRSKRRISVMLPSLNSEDQPSVIYHVEDRSGKELSQTKRRNSTPAFEFAIFELVISHTNRGHTVTRRLMFKGLEALDSATKFPALKTKLNEMKNADLLDWPARKPDLISITDAGRAKRAELWREVLNDEVILTKAFQSVGLDDYAFPKKM